EARSIVKSWNVLRRRIEHDGFPRPRKLGDRIRAWPEAEVQQWLDSRPLGGPVPLSGAASAKRKAELAARLDALSRAHRTGAAEIEHQRKQEFIEQRPDEATERTPITAFLKHKKMPRRSGANLGLMTMSKVHESAPERNNYPDAERDLRAELTAAQKRDLIAKLLKAAPAPPTSFCTSAE